MSKICVDEGTQNVTKAKPKSTQIPDEPVYTEFMIDNDADEVMNEYSDSDEDYRENLYAAGNPRNWLKDKMFIPNDFQIDCKKEVISAMKYFLQNIPVFIHRIRAAKEVTSILEANIKSAEQAIRDMDFKGAKEDAEDELFNDYEYTVGQWLKDTNEDILEQTLDYIMYPSVVKKNFAVLKKFETNFLNK